jgi:hypothetical protein
MEIFDIINAHLASSPIMLDQLEMMFRIKFWVLLAVAAYFLSLPYREQKKRVQLKEELAKNHHKMGKFIA